MTTEQLEVLLLATLAVMSLLALAGIILAGYDCIQHIRTIWTNDDDEGVGRTMSGTSRNTLAMHRLEEFAAWAEKVGFKREDPKGDYEVLRLRWPGGSPYLFFARDRTVRGNQPVHVTSQGEATQLVRRWIRVRDKSEAA